MPLDDGHTLHVVTSGSPSAPPLLMLHCWTGNWTAWDSTMRLLDGKFQFIVPDLLGFGDSSKPIGDHYQMDKQANQMRQIVRDFGHDKVSIIGHSMGGTIGLTFAALYPEMVDKLIVVSPSVTGRFYLSTGLVARVNMLGRRGIVAPMELTVNFGRLFPLALHDIVKYFMHPFAHPTEHPDEVMYWAHQSIANGQQYTAPWVEKAIQDWDTRPFLHKIQAETLSIWGKRDRLISTAEYRLLPDYVFHLREVIVPECGHLPMTEGWDIYAQAVTDFLSG